MTFAKELLVLVLEAPSGEQNGGNFHFPCLETVCYDAVPWTTWNVMAY